MKYRHDISFVNRLEEFNGINKSSNESEVICRGHLEAERMEVPNYEFHDISGMTSSKFSGMA